MNLTVTQTVTQLNLTVTQSGVSVSVQPVIALASQNTTEIDGGTP